MKFWVNTQFFGADATLVKQAAQECGIELVAVGFYSYDEYPKDKEYVEGKVEYLFLVEQEAIKDAKAAWDVAFWKVRKRVSELDREKYGDPEECFLRASVVE